MVFYIGKFSKPVDAATVVHIEDPADTENLQVGDTVERWDHIFEWDKYCLKASQLEAWRAKGDPLCDAALRSMFQEISSSPGVDLLECLYQNAALNPEGASHEFLEEVSNFPPADLAASQEEVQEGQEFFLNHSVGIMQGLLHFSLAGGFASPRITKVLQSVSYLVPPPRNGSVLSQMEAISPEMNDRAYTRLLETFQFVLDVMDCPPPAPTKGRTEESAPCLEPGGVGWKSIVRVRFLHGIARRRIMEHVQKNGYDVENDGIPINQEDMAATLAAFSVAPLWCLKRLYCLPIPTPSDSQIAAFISIWRHVGFYLGVDPVILRTHFASRDSADKFLASSVVHLLTATDSSPKGAGSEFLFPTLPILLATSNRPPFRRSFARSCALTHHMIGSSLASNLGVPPTPPREALKMRLALLVGQIPVFFSYVYPRRGWSVKRRTLTREALARVVCFQMDMRRTTFRARTDRGKLSPEVVAVEMVQRDQKRAVAMVRGYRALMLEMAGVILGSVVILAWVFVRSYAWCMSW